MAVVAGPRVRPADQVGRDPCLLPGRGQQPGSAAAELRAVADGQHPRVRRPQARVDDHPPAHGQAGGASESGPRDRSAGQDEQLGRQVFAVGEGEPGEVGLGDRDGDRPGRQPHPHAEAVQGAGQNVRARGVEHATEQPVPAVQDVDPQPAPGQTAGGFQAQRAAAEDHGALGVGGGGHQVPGVVDGTQGVDPGRHPVRVQSVQRRHDGPRTAGQHQPVEGDPRPVVERDRRLVRGQVDARHAGAQPHVHRSGRIPRGVGQPEGGDVGPAGDHVREQHPVVGPVRLGADHGDGGIRAGE